MWFRADTFGRALALAGLAGCFSPQPPAGAPCAPEGSPERCPSGQRCVIRGGVDICDSGYAPGVDAGDPGDSSDGDRDDDGLLDEEDNCADAPNPSQSDEDGDDLGDACDPCPPFADNDDADGDGVGDDCDPNPQVTGDALVVFEGFAGALPASWTVAGLFSSADGDGVAVAAENVSSLLTIASPPTMRVEIRAAATLDALTATGSNLGAFGVVDRLEPGTDKSVVCQLSGLANGAQEQLRIFDTDAMAIVNTASHAVAVGQRTQLRLRRDQTDYACHANNPSVQISGTAAFAPQLPRIGLRARGALVRYHWVMVVTSP